LHDILIVCLCGISFVQGCGVNGGGSCTSHKSNLLDDVMREKILVSSRHISKVTDCLNY